MPTISTNQSQTAVEEQFDVHVIESEDPSEQLAQLSDDEIYSRVTEEDGEPTVTDETTDVDDLLGEASGALDASRMIEVGDPALEAIDDTWVVGIDQRTTSGHGFLTLYPMNEMSASRADARVAFSPCEHMLHVDHSPHGTLYFDYVATVDAETANQFLSETIVDVNDVTTHGTRVSLEPMNARTEVYDRLAPAPLSFHGHEGWMALCVPEQSDSEAIEDMPIVYVPFDTDRSAQDIEIDRRYTGPLQVTVDERAVFANFDGPEDDRISQTVSASRIIKVPEEDVPAHIVGNGAPTITSIDENGEAETFEPVPEEVFEAP